MACSRYDDTFFIEPDEPHQHMITQDAIIMMVRQRQDITNAELSRGTSDAYLEDIMQHMGQMEVCKDLTHSHILIPKYTQTLTLPEVDLINDQEEIKWYMRPFLIDFLIEVHGEWACCLKPSS
jgi:hypothetical protein